MSIYISEVDNDTTKSNGVVMIGLVTNVTKGSDISQGKLIRGQQTLDVGPFELEGQSATTQLFVATVSSIAQFFLLNPTTVRMIWVGSNNSSNHNDYNVQDGESYALEVRSTGDVKGLTKVS